MHAAPPFDRDAVAARLLAGVPGAVDAGVWPAVEFALGEALAGRGTVEAVLGIDRPGRLRLRDAALARAEALLRAGRELTLDRRAKALAAAVRYFEKRRLPLLHAGAGLALEPWEAELRQAFACGVRVTGSARRLRDVLAASDAKAERRQNQRG